jgi:hypothetical protein
MPRSCTICTHPQRTAIETALVAGDAFRIIAKRFGTSPAALFRHKGHLTKRPPTTRSSAHGTTRDDAPQARTMAREPRLFPEITHVKKRAFLMGFVQTGSRVKAAKLAQMDDRMHWHWLKTDPIYTAAFGRAEQMAGDRVEDRLYTLSLEGTRKGVYHNGVRIGEEEVVYPTLILAALNGIKPERYKYRIDTTHSVSPAMQALMQQWQALREQPLPARQALPERPDDADATDVAVVPLDDSRTPGRTRRADVFKMLDALNQGELEGDTDDDG